jgi:hypothetical protein
VARLLASPGQQAAVQRFFREYLQYERVDDVFKEPKLFPFHNPTLLTDDTAAWIQALLERDGGKKMLRALLTDASAVVRKKTAPSYDVDAATVGDKPQLVTLPNRAGLLTQPSVLAALSESDHNDPVKRGKFILETLLCGQVPSLPIGQIPPLPEARADTTLRSRLAMHTAEPACRTCHQWLDPLGLGLESYDHVGRFRTMEAGRPVDASGELRGAGEVDGPFQGAAELAAKLAASPVVSACFVRHTFRYWMGRQERPEDGCGLRAAHEAFRKDGDYVALLQDLFTSRAFLERTAR